MHKVLKVSIPASTHLGFTPMTFVAMMASCMSEVVVILVTILYLLLAAVDELEFEAKLLEGHV